MYVFISLALNLSLREFKLPWREAGPPKAERVGQNVARVLVGRGARLHVQECLRVRLLLAQRLLSI